MDVHNVPLRVFSIGQALELSPLLPLTLNLHSITLVPNIMRYRDGPTVQNPTKVPEKDEDQFLIIDRVYTKIDYLKNARLRIPAFSIVANFGLLTLSLSEKIQEISTVFVVTSFFFIGTVSVRGLFVVKQNFDTNIKALRELYEARGISKIYAESADDIWALLFALILIGTVLPTAILIAR